MKTLKVNLDFFKRKLRIQVPCVLYEAEKQLKATDSTLPSTVHRTVKLQHLSADCRFTLLCVKRNLFPFF